MLKLLLFPLLGYLIGSISSAVLVSRLLGLPDPRTSGSNNPGATNVLRLGGTKAAVITLVGDLLKGLLPVLLARMITASPVLIALVGISAFLGHLYPLYFGFKGGKGVATAAGVFLGISGTAALLLVAIWLVIAVTFRYSSLAALVTAALSPLVIFMLAPGLPFLLLACGITVLLFWRHRSNIERLRKRQESKIQLFSKR